MPIRFTPLLALATLCPVAVQAGVVTFEPVIPGSEVVHVDNLPASVDYNVFIMPDPEGEFGGVVDSYDVLIGTNDPYLGLDFAWTWSSCAPNSAGCGILGPVGRYDGDDLYAGAMHLGSDASTPPGYLFGVLTASAPPGTPMGDHVFQVDSDEDFGFSVIGRGAIGEPLYGQGVLTVVPEPGAGLLLAFGAIAVAARVRSARGKSLRRGRRITSEGVAP